MKDYRQVISAVLLVGQHGAFRAADVALWVAGVAALSAAGATWRVRRHDAG